MTTPALVTSRRSFGSLLVKLGPILALVLLLVILSIFSEHFRKPENFIKILNQSSFVGIVAIGMTWVIIVGGIDLSVGSMVALLAGLGVMAMNRVYAGQIFEALPAEMQKAHLEAMEAAATLSTSARVSMTDVLRMAIPDDVRASVSMLPSIGVAAAIMIVGGAVLGVTNGLSIRVGKLAPFIATLGTMAIFRSIILASAKGGEIRSQVAGFEHIGKAANGLTIPTWLMETSKGKPLVATWPIITFLVLAVVAELSLRKTTFGRKVLATGDNPVAARYAGIKTGHVTMVVYMMCGVLCGIAALMNSSRMTAVSSPQTGSLYELDAIAAVVIGGTAMRGGSGWVVGTVVGVIILGVIDNMLVMFNVNDKLQGLVKGCIIIAAVLIQRRRSSK